MVNDNEWNGSLYPTSLHASCACIQAWLTCGGTEPVPMDEDADYLAKQLLMEDETWVKQYDEASQEWVTRPFLGTENSIAAIIKSIQLINR